MKYFEFDFGESFSLSFILQITYLIREYLSRVIQIGDGRVFYLVLYFTMILSEISCGILGVYSYYKSKTSRTQVSALLKKSVLNLKKPKTSSLLEKICKFTAILFVFIGISLLDSFGFILLLSSYGRLLDPAQFLAKLCQIFFFAIFSNWLLGMNFYKHRKISLMIMGISFLILFCYYFLLCNISPYLNFWYFICSFCGYFFYSVQNILIHWIVKNYYYSVYRCIFFNGLINLCFGIGLLISESDTLLYLWKERNFEQIDFYFGFIVIYMLLLGISINILTHYIGDKHTLCNITIGDSILTTLIYFIFLIAFSVEVFHRWNIFLILCFIISIISIIVFSISSLIFNEVIIVNRFKLGFNTRKRIIERTKEDPFLNEIENIGINEEKHKEDRNSEETVIVVQINN